MRIPTASRQQWLRYQPPQSRDIRRLSPTFISLRRAETERDIRAQILLNGNAADRRLGAILMGAKRNVPAKSFCCPITARQFQIFFVSRALEIARQEPGQRTLLTIFDPGDAVASEQLDQVDWRKMHARLRRRLERQLGSEIVALGMGELEYDEVRDLWQPHYHLVVWGASKESLINLRQRHYQSEKGEARPMVISKETNFPGWLSYMAKQTAFRKYFLANGKLVRNRLRPRQLRHMLRYAAMKSPTTYVFTLNCTLTRRRATEDVAVNKSEVLKRR